MNGFVVGEFAPPFVHEVAPPSPRSVFAMATPPGTPSPCAKWWLLRDGYSPCDGYSATHLPKTRGALYLLSPSPNPALEIDDPIPGSTLHAIHGGSHM